MRCDEPLTPLDVHFRVGTRSELDRKFRRAIVEGKQPGQNMSDFVKLAVVEWHESKQERQEEVSEAEKVRRELEAKIRRLEETIRSGAGMAIENAATAEREGVNDKMDEAKTREAEAKVRALTDAF